MDSITFKFSKPVDHDEILIKKIQRNIAQDIYRISFEDGHLIEMVLQIKSPRVLWYLQELLNCKFELAMNDMMEYIIYAHPKELHLENR